MIVRRPFAFVALALFAAGCVTQHPAGFTNGHAYYRSHEHYRVRLAGDALMPAPWELEVGPGAPRFVERPLPLYYPRAWGELRVPRWDLRFVHERTGGAMWSRTMPVATMWWRDPLEVLLSRSVFSLTTPSAVAPDLFGEVVHASGVAIRAQGPARVDGRDGRYITFDVTRPLEDDVRTDRVTVVAVPLDASFRYLRWRVPAIALFAHASAPARHAAQQPTSSASSPASTSPRPTDGAWPVYFLTSPRAKMLAT